MTGPHTIWQPALDRFHSTGTPQIHQVLTRECDWQTSPILGDATASAIAILRSNGYVQVILESNGAFLQFDLLTAALS